MRVLQEWPSQGSSRVHGADREVALQAALNQSARTSDFEQLQLPKSVTDLIDERAVAALNRGLADDAEEDPDLFNQLKVDASIMRLHKRDGVVTELNWQLAGHLMELDSGLRQETQRLISTTNYRRQVKAAHVQGRLADAALTAQEHQALKRVAALLIRHLTEAGGELFSSGFRNKLSSRDRDHYSDPAWCRWHHGLPTNCATTSPTFTRSAARPETLATTTRTRPCFQADGIAMCSIGRNPFARQACTSTTFSPLARRWDLETSAFATYDTPSPP